MSSAAVMIGPVRNQCFVKSYSSLKCVLIFFAEKMLGAFKTALHFFWQKKKKKKKEKMPVSASSTYMYKNTRFF